MGICFPILKVWESCIGSVPWAAERGQNISAHCPTWCQEVMASHFVLRSQPTDSDAWGLEMHSLEAHPRSQNRYYGWTGLCGSYCECKMPSAVTNKPYLYNCLMNLRETEDKKVNFFIFSPIYVPPPTHTHTSCLYKSKTAYINCFLLSLGW